MTCKRAFLGTLFMMLSNSEEPKGLLTIDWIKKSWHIFITKNHTAMKIDDRYMQQNELIS
jgi:hypothetical protein